MQKELACTCDVNAEGMCDFCWKMEIERKDYDLYHWDAYEEHSNVPYFDPEDDDLPF